MRSILTVFGFLLLPLIPCSSRADESRGQLAAPWPVAMAQMNWDREGDNRKFNVVSHDGNHSELAQKYWVYFTDKGIFDESSYLESVGELPRNCSRRSYERRRLRRTPAGLFDGHDLPIAPSYLKSIAALDVQLCAQSRWLNSVSVLAKQSQVMQIASLPFVRKVSLVRRAGREDLITTSSSNPQERNGNRDFYGYAQTQLEQINLPALHDRGFTGESVIIGVLDSGFRRDHLAFNHPNNPIEVLAEWDFMNDDDETGIEAGDASNQHFHGTAILGALATYLPEEMVGAAYDASYVLAKVEDAASEFPLEEDWFAAGLEFLEAQGCDVATSSLIAYWYEQEDMDGETSVMAQMFNIATANGMHCCQAAGNEGHDGDPEISHLTTPADAFDVISCGGLDINGNVASFSSDGPTKDGRVKPEVMARAANAWTVDAYSANGYVTVSGTSIAAPQLAGLVACLVQAHPDWSVEFMRQRLFQTSDFYLAHGTHDPLFVKGFGTLDALAAEDTAVGVPSDPDSESLATGVYPNPFSDRTSIQGSLPSKGHLYLELYDVTGRRVRLDDLGVRNGGRFEVLLKGEDLPNGLYLYRLFLENRPLNQGKLLIVN